MYSFRRELTDHVVELRDTTPLPEGFTQEEFLSGANFEFHPSSLHFLFCWCHDTVAGTLWLFEHNRWEVFHNVSSENLAKHLLKTIGELDPLVRAEQAKGCGIIMESLFALRGQN